MIKQVGSVVSAVLSLLLAVVSPTAAGFNDLLQVICDEDNPIAASCDATVDGFRFVHAIAASSDDKHVYACSSLPDALDEAPLQDETLSAFSRAVDGTLTLVDQEIQGGSVTTLDSCRGLAVSPDGKHVYTAALTSSAVTWFSRDAMTGALTFTAGDAISGAPGSSLGGANAVTVSPDDKHVYVASRSADAVAAFSRDTTSGDLTSIGDYFDDDGTINGLDTALDIAVSPDGKHVYVTGESDNAVAVFSRDTNSGSGTFGELTFVEALIDGVGGVDGLEEAGSVALDPSGDNVYVGSGRSFPPGDWVAIFSRSSATGALTFLESIRSTDLTVSINCGGVGPTPSAVSVSPDGLFVAVSEPFRAAITTFSRATDGTLTLAESICDDVFVLEDGIGSVIDLAHSPDGKNLYSAGGAFESVATVDSECDSADVDLTLTGSVSTTESETACRSIEVLPNYDVLAAGDVTMTAPRLAVNNDVSVIGNLTLVSGVP